jgi:DNA-binding transcriptional MerR regulator
MRISDVANKVGIPVSTIRYYEKNAVIPKPHRSGRDRSFSQEDVRAIQFVRDAQSLGLPLNEISTLLQSPWDNGEMAKTASIHRETVRLKIEVLRRVEKVLKALESCSCKSFATCNLDAYESKRGD